jgi:RHS repeat-associated protein
MTTAAICATREVSWWPSYYRGEQYDSDLGLYYLRARYYNPATGRFLSRDPLNGNAFDPKTLHKYLYAGGDPVNATDPTGKGIVETVWNWAKSVAATVVEASWVKHFVASCLIATAIVTAYVYHHPIANVAWPEVVIWGGLGCNLVWVYGT